MRNIFLAVLFGVATTVVATAQADEPQEGSRVVAENEDCPSGMVVSGMTGGEDSTTKICVSPNTAEMPADDSDVGDPNTSS